MTVPLNVHIWFRKKLLTTATETCGIGNIFT
jgi:hypothetical protein